jgi:hypothetical protein
MEFLAKKKLSSSSSSSSWIQTQSFRVIDLNLELDKIANKKPTLYVLPPMRVSFPRSPHSPYGTAKVLIGGRSIDGEDWKSKSLEFSGPLELSGDTALGPGRRLEIKWKGEKANESLPGEIKIGWDKSEYKLKVPYLGGEVIAHLKDDSGDVIGEAKIPLGNPLGLVQLNKSPIKIRPVRKSISYQDFNKVTSGNNSGTKLRPQVDLAHREGGVLYYDEGDYLTKSLSVGSSTLARAHHEGFSSVLTLVSDHIQQQIPMMPIKTDKSYREWLSDLIGERVTNIHIGRVLNKEKPQSGVGVTIETEKFHKVFYLNEFYIPDERLKNTTSNGYFMVVNLDPGLYNLTVTGLGQKLAYSQFVMDKEGYSYGDHLIGFQSQRKRAKVFDFFSGANQSAYVYGFSREEPDLIEGEGFIQTEFSSIGQSFFSISPQSSDYLKVTLVHQLEQKEIEVPLVSSVWFNEFLILNRVTYNQDSAFVIGYFSADVVNLEFPLISGVDKVLYFNSAGERVNRPEVGGGFILTNVPIGEPQIMIQENVDGTQHSRVFSVEAGEILVLQMTSF